MDRTLGLSFAALIGLTLASPGGAADDEQKVARDVIDKAIKSVGGADNLGKMKSVTWKSKGKVTVSDSKEVSLNNDWSAKGLDKYHIVVNAVVDGNTINLAVVINGDKGWAKGNDKAAELPKEVTTAVRTVARAGRLTHFLPALKDKPYELSPLGELKVGDREAVGIRVAQKGHPDVSLYFDKKTGVPLKTEVRAIEMASGPEVLFEVYYTDYKDFDGIQHCTKLTVKRDDKTFLESELSDFKPQDLDDGLFDKP